jgi:hypothetical protein
MRGEDERSGSLFSYVDLEARVGRNHPLRMIRTIVNKALARLAGAMELGQHHGVATIRFDPVSRFHRNERRRRHHAVVAKGDELAEKAVAAGPGFVPKRQCAIALRQPLDQFLDGIRPVEKIAELQDLAASSALGDRLLVDIETHKNGSVHQARPPCLRLGASQPGAILD